MPAPCVRVGAMTTTCTEVASPIGPLLVAGDETGITNISFGGEPAPDWIRDDTRLAAARTQLEEYFAGDRQEFDLPLSPRGSESQMLVWKALQEIPYGQTASYGAIAARIGRPGAA